MATPPPSLAEACAPVFLYLTTFRRNAATSAISIEALQNALQHEIDGARRRCEPDPHLRRQFDRVQYGLVAAADQVVLSSAWPQRAGWTMRLLEMQYFKTAVGGKKFFALVEEVLDDPGEDAPALAEILFTCMAFGFQGELRGETRELERRRRRLYEKARLPGRLGAELAPDAYGRNSSRRVARLPALGILRMLIIPVGALLLAYGTGKVWTRFKNNKRIDEIQEIEKILQDHAAANHAAVDAKPR